MNLTDVRTYLIGLSLVSGDGTGDNTWPCYCGYIPDESDQTVALFETGGYPPDTLGRENERVTFQVRVRGARLDYDVVKAKWQAIFDALHDSAPTAEYALVQALHYGPMMFNDDKGRTNMTSNFRVTKVRTT